MTDRKEIDYLMDKANKAGRVARFDNSRPDGIFYQDPQGAGLLKRGIVLGWIGFAERERQALAWWQQPATETLTVTR